MNALVTGATGLLGNNLTRILCEQGVAVRAASRTATRSRALEGLDVERLDLDLNDPDQISQAVYGVDIIYHCAACVRIGWFDLDEHRSVNIDAVRRVATLARENSIRLVHVSSVNALGLGSWDQPGTEEQSFDGIVPCPYVTTKQEADAMLDTMVAEEGLDCVIALPGYMLGPWDWRPSSGEMLLSVAKGAAPLTPTGGMSLCDARDVAQGLINAGARGRAGRKYILAGHNLSYREAWTLMASMTGRKPPTLPMGPLARTLVGPIGDLFSKIRGQEAIVNSAAIRLSCQPHLFSSQRAIEEIDYSIRPAANIVEDAWNWFVEQGYV